VSGPATLLELPWRLPSCGAALSSAGFARCSSAPELQGIMISTRSELKVIQLTS
jgi:hypothetical protein